MRLAPDRATNEVVGVSLWPRRIASTGATSSCRRRQNNDSPSIIILQVKPDESSAFIARPNRDETSPTQFENFRDKIMKLEYEGSRRNFSMRARPQALIIFLREWFASTRRVEIGPKPADTILNEEGRSSFFMCPISGAPGTFLTVSPPEKTDATVPNPVLHSTSQR